MLSLWTVALIATSPIYFESTPVQTDRSVLARSHSGPIALEVYADHLRLRGPGGQTELQFTRGRARATHFRGELRARIREAGRNISAFERVELDEVWPGIDLVLHERNQRFSFDL